MACNVLALLISNESIRAKEGECIIKHLLGSVEAYAVLSLIASVFANVPFEAHAAPSITTLV